MKSNLVRATAVTKRFTSGRLQKLDPVPYCMYTIEYISESESDNKSVELIEPMIGKGKSLKKKNTPDIEIIKVSEPTTVSDEPMDVETPKWDSYAIHASNMSQQIERVTSQIERREVGPSEVLEPVPQLFYLPTETRTYTITNPRNGEFITQIEIPLLISDRLMEEEVMQRVQQASEI